MLFSQLSRGAVLQTDGAQMGKARIPKLSHSQAGGLHTALKFMEVIGKHVQSSGLQEAWVEGNLLGPTTAEKAIAGKSHDKGMRAHKITDQAMWRILLPQLPNFMSALL